MGQEVVSKGTSACAHGGIYSVNYRLVKLDCSSSVNPLGTPRSALQAIIKRAKELSSRYPDPECTELRNSLARYMKVDPGWILVGNGAIEIIYWFSQAFAGKRVVIPAPTFCEYELASHKAGADVKLVTLPEYKLESDSIIKQTKGADALFLCNPNNPTGLLATEEIEKILTNIDNHAMVLLDECFIELVDRVARNSFVTRIREFENLVILRSLTKSFGLAGLRVGYACCSPSTIDKLKRYRIPWNVNGLAQAAGVAALSDPSHLKRARAVLARERQFLHDKISEMDSYVPRITDSNYFMLNLRQRNSTKFRDELLKKTGILVRDCSTFTGMDSHHVRIAVRTHKDNLRLVNALKAIEHG